MGIDAGFDMVPHLSKGAVDRQNWHQFIRLIKELYKDDDLVEIKPNYMVFKAGEHPRLPFEGHKFLRFSSKISGSRARGVEKYINKVTRVAEIHFASRIQAWNEGRDQRGFYGWQDVIDSIKSYEQPDEPEIPTSRAQFKPGTDPVSEPDLPLFEIQSIPGKGRGLVARVNIAKGKRILCEKPLLTSPSLTPSNMMELTIAAKLKALSKLEQRQFLSLHNNFPGKDPFAGTVKTNALPCGFGSVIGGVYPTICLINHSCLPNAHNGWNSETECETVHAIRHIRSGEEITISYENGRLFDPRSPFLRDPRGFDCTCDRCSLRPAELLLSDTRRVEIRVLDDAIGDPARMLVKPDDCLADCRQMLRVLREEYKGSAGALVSRPYHDAFLITIAHGDQARASVFVEREYRARVMCEGEDNPETAKSKSLMENPAAHANFGASKRWRTTRSMVPKRLDVDEFEEWLWRQGR